MRIIRWIVFIAWLAAINGCAINNKTFGTRNKAFHEGQALILNGELELGLQKLRQAAQEEPENKEIRAVLMRERETIAGQMLFDAENSRLFGDLETAGQIYHRVLELFPRNERAQAGLEALELERQHITEIDYAKELLALNDVEGAEKTVRTVLQENSEQAHARQLIKEISKRIARAERTSLTLETAFKKPFTMEFRDTDLKSVFEIMAKTAGVNFVFDKDVRQEAKVSIFVRDNSIEDILNLILLTNQLAYKVLNKNSLIIYPNTPAKQKEYQELVVRSFHAAHTDVKQMVAMVRGLVKAKDIYVNEKLNLFVMRDTLEAVRLVERLVTLNDLPEPEVMLEVVILTVSRSNNFLLGPNFPQSITGAFVSPASGILQEAAGTVTFDAIRSAGFPSLKNFAVSNQMAIDFMQNFSSTDILANPRIRVKNREAAKIHIGTREPVFSATVSPGVSSIVTSTPTYLELGTKLDIEPIIGFNNDVTMKVTLEVSSKGDNLSGPGGATAPRIETSNAETLLTLKDGETQVLGGLIQDDDIKSIKGLAGLINIPGFDRLTSNQKVDRLKRELVLLITPRIIRNITQPLNSESEFHFGTANEAGKLPVKISTTAPQSLALATSSAGGAALDRGAGTFTSPDRSMPAVNPFAANMPSAPVLTINAPANIGLDKEFPVRVRMVGAKASITAELQLSYDTDMLELLDGEGGKSSPQTIKLGRDEASGMTAQLRFKVKTANPGTTEVAIHNATAEDKESGESIEVALPPPTSINIQP